MPAPKRFHPFIRRNQISTLEIYEFQGSGENGLLNHIMDFESKWELTKRLVGNVELIPKRLEAQNLRRFWMPVRPHRRQNVAIRGDVPALKF